MRKLTFIAAVAALTCMCSCGSNSKVELRTQMDSLSYLTGYGRSDGFMDYLGQYGITEDQLPTFLKGFEKGTGMDSEDDNAYMIGMQIGSTVAGWADNLNEELIPEDSLKFKSFSKELLIKGFLAAIKGTDKSTDVAQAQAYSNLMTNAMYESKQASQFVENRTSGEQFLAENAKKEGVVTTGSGLQYKVIKQGSGNKPSADSRVKVNYWGKLVDGTQFDSSYDRGEPTEFKASEVIAGWTEVLQLMPVGSTYEVYIPYNLAYGSQENSVIPPYSALIFQIELLDIVK